MPGFDGTGPQGRGAMTGGGFGRCNAGWNGGMGFGRRGGRGRGGFGRGRGFGAYPGRFAPASAMTGGDELAMLKAQADAAKAAYESLNSRIAALAANEGGDSD